MDFFKKTIGAVRKISISGSKNLHPRLEKLREQLEKSSWAFRCLVTTQNTAAIKNLERFVVPASIVAKLYALPSSDTLMEIFCDVHGDFPLTLR